MSDDLRHRYAEALAAKFTRPAYRCDKRGENEWVENPEPADRIGQTPRIMLIAGDGHPSFRMPTCAELGEVVAAVRDNELETAQGIIKRLCEHQGVMEGHVDLAQQAAEVESGLAQGWQERAEKAEAEQEEEYQRAERLHEETSLLLGRAHNAERNLDRANEALMRVRGVLHEGRSEAETLAIIRRAIAGPLSERDRDLEEARRARETADIHWGRAEQRAEKAETALAELHAYAVHRRSCRADGAGEPCTCGLAALRLPEPR